LEFFLDDPSLLYPFFYRSSFTIVEDGWTAFSTEAEFSQLVIKSDEWRISHVNKAYAVRFLIHGLVPIKISPRIIAQIDSMRYL